ncbi:unnamed protein product [Closterium sp. NIES-53]
MTPSSYKPQEPRYSDVEQCHTVPNHEGSRNYPPQGPTPREMLHYTKAGVAVFDLDYDAILAAMYALSTSDEGDCCLCVPPDLGIEAAALGAGETAALGASASAAPGAGESAPSDTASAQVFHTFTLDSGASRSFFRDRTTLTPLSRPVAVSLADPSAGPVLASFSTVLPCPAAPPGSLSGLYLPSFSTNLVSGADLQDQGVDQFTPASQRVTHCTCARTGRHLATFTRRPGSSLYTLSTESPPASGQVAASSQVLAAASGSGPESAPCSCRLLSHQTLLWHHRLGHPSLPRLRGMASRVLVSGLPRSLPPLPPACFALLDWSCDPLFSPTLPMGGLAPTLLLLTLATPIPDTPSASPIATSPTASAAATPTADSTTATRAPTPATTPTAATTSTSAPSTTPAATSTTAAATTTTPATLALAVAALRTSRSSPDVLRNRDVCSSSRGEGGGKGGGGAPLKEGQARSATSSTYSKCTSLSCKEMLLKEVKIEGGGVKGENVVPDRAKRVREAGDYKVESDVHRGRVPVKELSSNGSAVASLICTKVGNQVLDCGKGGQLGEQVGKKEAA